MAGPAGAAGHWRPALIAFILLLVLTALKTWNPSFVEELEIKTYDVYQQIQPRPAPEMAVVVVDIDEASLAELGQWPWSRKTVGDILLNIAKAGGCGGRLRRRVSPSPITCRPSLCRADAQSRRDDQGRARADAEHRRVFRHGHQGDPRGARPSRGQRGAGRRRGAEPAARRGAQWHQGVGRTFFAVVQQYRRQSARARESGGRARHVHQQSGIRRHRAPDPPAIVRVGDQIYPTLSIEMLRVATGGTTILVRSTEVGIQDIVLQGPNYVIPDRPAGPAMAALRQVQA
ncbi:MAG: CHASE2 domain-containing protein [Pseudomonadota bacterium]